MSRYIFQSGRQNIVVEEYLLETSFTLSIQTNVLHILHTVVAAHFLQILKVVQKFYMQFSFQTKSQDQASQGHPIAEVNLRLGKNTAYIISENLSWIKLRHTLTRLTDGL